MGRPKLGQGDWIHYDVGTGVLRCERCHATHPLPKVEITVGQLNKLERSFRQLHISCGEVQQPPQQLSLAK